MSRRHLSEHQLRRIRQQQKDRRGRSRGRDPDTPPSGDDGAALGTEQPGLVVCHYGQQLDIESLHEDTDGELFRCHQRSNLPPLVTGDRVIWQPDDAGGGVVVALEPRRSELVRPGFRGELRPVASNIDRVLVVIAPAPEPHANLIDRYLVAVETLGLEPAIVLNKTDLIRTDEQRQSLQALLGIYRDIGYAVLETCCQSGSGLDELRHWLQQHTAVLVGQSGVGKSSLINALRRDAGLLPEDDAAIGALSTGRTTGTHTTTATRLYHLPNSGDLIDSPGIREFSLWPLEPAELMRAFVEFRPWLGRCRFRDCSHQHEPGCALRAAVAAGDIHPGRLASYQHILSAPSA
ncbi:MAG: small ribosomal subunit biogenesis GTPase RsgA [Pseudomonadota bacterium]